MTNKQSIYETLKGLTEESVKNGGKNITAKDIAILLNLKRNVASHYLNELFSEGKIIKTNMRPVYFLDKEIYENNKSKITLTKQKVINEKLDKLEEDTFSKLIGFSGSLKSQVEQCKVVVSYPPNGLPILLVGKSGVGKSFIAQLIYEYAVQNNYINEVAPYAIFNCAEYANNPELLSANLFGYQKGTFTGAVSDKIGLIEEADGGYLLLDEVHRLSHEGQEKLFLFLDKGIFKRFGESGKWRKANVRFIFATTQEPEEFLLETFLRRIPLIVKVPSLSERPISEKIQMIYSFYKQEALNLQKDINISSQVIDVLLSINMSGNIGKLINIIKYSCAHAYNLEGKNIPLFNINLSNLPKYTLLNIQTFKGKYNVKNMLVNKSNDDFLIKNLSLLNEDSKINRIIIDLSNSVINHKNDMINSSEFEKLSVLNINKLSDELIFNKEKYEIDAISLNIINKLMNNIMKTIEDFYGIKYYGNTIDVLTHAISYFWENISNISKKDERLFSRAKKVMEKSFPKSFIISNKILSIIEDNIDYKFDDRVLIYLMFYIFNIIVGKVSKITSIIIAHGHSTASSIAIVANKLLGEFVFEAFDIPIEVPIAETMKEIKQYLNNIAKSKEIILLVDMGSLEDINKALGNIDGDIGIVDNITTQLALDVGNKIILGQSIEQIMDVSARNNVIHYKFIKSDREKRKAIITTCISGIETAVKLRDLLKKCISCTEIEIIAYDFDKLKNNGISESVFKDYQIILIIGTADPEIDEIPYLYLEDLISGKREAILSNILESSINCTNIEQVNRDIVKIFSLQNVLNQLTILNPNKIIDMVERILTNFELGIGVKLQNDLKISLYIHISILLERLIIKEGNVSYQNIAEFEKSHSFFVELIRKSFSVILDSYKIELPVDEIIIIYEFIKIKMPDLNV